MAGQSKVQRRRGGGSGRCAALDGWVAFAALIAVLSLCESSYASHGAAVPAPGTHSRISYLPIPGNVQVNLVQGPDGRIWTATTPAGDLNNGVEVPAELVAVSSSGQVQKFPKIKLAETFPNPNGLTVGGGRIWLTGQRGGVASVGTDGQVVKYERGFQTQAPATGITTAPNGTIWFTDDSCTGGHHPENVAESCGYDGVGKVAPDGAVHDYPQSSSGGSWSAILPGPPGLLWVEEACSSDNRAVFEAILECAPGYGSVQSGLALLSATTGAVVRRVRMPVTAAEKREIDKAHSYEFKAVTVTPDGTAFVVVEGRLKRVSASGGVTNFAARGLSGLSLLSLYGGPGGMVWFGARGRHGQAYVGSVSADGAVHILARLRTGSRCKSILLAAHGTLWCDLPGAVGKHDTLARIQPSH